MQIFTKLNIISLIILLLFSLIPKVDYVIANDYIIEDKTIYDELIEDGVETDNIISDTYIIDNMIYDQGIYEVKINDNMVVDSYIIDLVVGEMSEEEFLSQLPEEYSWSDIDWASVIGKFAIGTSIIVVVGAVSYYTNGVTNFILASPAKVAKDAVIGGAMSVASNLVLNSDKIDSLDTAVRKYSIESFADGYMWGAIESVSASLVKYNFSQKTLNLLSGKSLKIKLNGDVVNNNGKKFGKLIYDTDKLYLIRNNKYRVFDLSGEELTDIKVTKLKSNSKYLTGSKASTTFAYSDDKGNIYRVGTDLLKSTKYTINGYSYTTDEFSRITRAYAKKLSLKDHKGRKLILNSMQDIAKGFQEVDDERGHLFADMFGGDNSLANLVAMSSEVNQKEFKKLEQTWKKALEKKKSVEVEIILNYTEESSRPDSFKIIYSIDNNEKVKKISNK